MKLVVEGYEEEYETRGEWRELVQYFEGDVVLFGLLLWVSCQDNVDEVPGLSSAWILPAWILRVGIPFIDDEVDMDVRRTVEDSSLLTANSSRDGRIQSTNRSTLFRAFASSNVAGTLKIQQSRDTITWYTTVSQALTVGSTEGTVIESIVVLPFVRAQYTNGTTTQTQFEFDTALLVVLRE